MKYYVADLHFGHRNILSLCNRPFQTVEQMDQTLISNWNNTVSDQDEIYIVGDLFYRSTQVETILKQLKGKKILIFGNHDIQWINDDLITKYFSSVHQWLEITDQHQRVFLAHYPMLSYPKQSTTYIWEICSSSFPSRALLRERKWWSRLLVCPLLRLRSIAPSVT